MGLVKACEVITDKQGPRTNLDKGALPKYIYQTPTAGKLKITGN